MAKLTKRVVDALAADPGGADVFVWDDELRGFGVRMKPSGVASYLVQCRTPEGQTRRKVIGRVGTLTSDEARKLARADLSAVAGGADPSKERHAARTALTVKELCDLYLEAARAGLVMTRFRRQKRPSTVAIDEGRVARHINPLIGQCRADKLSRAEVQRMVDAIAKGKTAGVFAAKPRGKAVVTGGAGTAARVVELLGGIWTWAEKRGHVSGTNPAHGVETSRSEAQERTLSGDELAALGKALSAAEATRKTVAAAVRLIALTGLRREEACGLRWREVDALGSCLRLESSKTGRSVRPIGRAALELLQSLRDDGAEFVFPNRAGTGSADLKAPIADLFDAAGLADARSHDLRRTFATTAADEGYGDATIGELLGHARRGVTAKHYIRRPDAALVAAADRVAGRIVAVMEGRKEDAQILPLRAGA